MVPAIIKSTDHKVEQVKLCAAALANIYFFLKHGRIQIVLRTLILCSYAMAACGNMFTELQKQTNIVYHLQPVCCLVLPAKDH